MTFFKSDKSALDLPVKYSELEHWERAGIRKAYITLQEGLCYHCKENLAGGPAEAVSLLPIERSLFPQGFFNSPVHLHHSHDTDLTIGAVHAYCNAVLWIYHGE